MAKQLVDLLPADPSIQSLKDDVRQIIDHYFDQTAMSMPNNLYSDLLEHIEAALLSAVMEQACFNQMAAANYLGLAYGTMRGKLKKHFGNKYFSRAAMDRAAG